MIWRNCPEKFRKINWKNPVPESFLIASLKSSTVLRKRLQLRCFPVNFVNCFRICLCRRPPGDFSVFYVIQIAKVLPLLNKEFNRPSRSVYSRYATIYIKTWHVESYLENSSKVSRVFKKAFLKKVSLLCRFLSFFSFGYIKRAKHDELFFSEIALALFCYLMPYVW